MKSIFRCRNVIGPSLVLLLAILIASPLLSQSGTRGSGSRGSGTRPRTSQPQTTQPKMALEQYAVAFWNHITRGRTSYRNWKPLPDREDELYAGEKPHGAFLRMYANTVAARDAKGLPHGSIIVTENFADDKLTLQAITVMYRVQRFDPAHGDWFYIAYQPDGSVLRAPADQGGQPIIGRAQSCIACHQDAAGGDYVFGNK